jgi:hypothetical protein
MQGFRHVGSVLIARGQTMTLRLQVCHARHAAVSPACDGRNMVSTGIEPVDGRLRDYRWPTSPWLRLPARLLVSSYARWCCRQAMKDAVKLAS